MPVKYWSFAGLMLTYWCGASCASCYVCCSPARREEMAADDALAFWRGLVEASPHGCRVHLSGGEPFGDWPRLIDLCLRARGEGLGPLDKVETNAFWATDAAAVRDRLRALDEAGMGKLVISADPYHQQFVPIARCRLAAEVAEEVLGAHRVLVRWRDWLADGSDTDSLTEAQRAALFARYASAGRDRLSGRAAKHLAPLLPPKPLGELADRNCARALLRSRHVHVDPAGRVMPGTCCGIVLGNLRTAARQPGASSVAELWRQLDEGHARRPIVGVLAARGPAGLLEAAAASGFEASEGYVGHCHLCWELRRHFVRRGLHAEELAPAWIYEE